MRPKPIDVVVLVLAVFGVLIGVALIARACVPEPTPTVTATATVRPSSTATVAPSATATATLPPTVTRTPTVFRPTDRPTATFTPRPTSTPTVVPTFEPTREKKERRCVVYVTAAELIELNRRFYTDCKIVIIGDNQ